MNTHRVPVGERLGVLEADLADVVAERVGQRRLVLQPRQRFAAAAQSPSAAEPVDHARQRLDLGGASVLVNQV